MLSIDGIRNAFSKGSIAITHAGITVFYQHRGTWITQEIESDSIGTFSGLLEKFDCMEVQCIKGKMIKLTFRKELEGQEMVLYSPVREEMSLEELHELINDLDDPGNERARDEFFNFFIGTSLDDDDAVLAKLREFVESKSEKSNVISIPTYARWRELRRNVSAFAGLYGLEIEEQEPDGDTNGYIEVFFPENYDKPVRIAGKSKEFLLKSLQTCSLLSIDCSVADGFLNMVFYN